MRSKFSVFLILVSALSVFSTVVPVSQSKIVLTPLAISQPPMNVIGVGGAGPSELQLITVNGKDTFLLFLHHEISPGVDAFDNIFIVKQKSSYVLYSDTNYMTYPVMNDQQPEVRNPNNQKRIYRMGDSIVVMVFDSTNNTYTYTRKISELLPSNTYNVYGIPWNFCKYSYKLIDTLRSNNVFTIPTVVKSITNSMIYSKLWVTTNGSFTKTFAGAPDSTLTIQGTTLISQPLDDFKGNLWAYGMRMNMGMSDTVLVKYERISKQAFYYSLKDDEWGVTFKNQILNRDLSKNLTSGYIARADNRMFFTCYLSDKPYVTPTDTITISATQFYDSIYSSYDANVKYPIHVYDDIYRVLYKYPTGSVKNTGSLQLRYLQTNDSMTYIGNGNTIMGAGNIILSKIISNLTPKISTAITTNSMTYSSVIIRNQMFDTTSYCMYDTVNFKILFLNSKIKADSIKDTSISTNSSYSKTFTVKNNVGLSISSSLPAWLKLELVNEVPFTTTASADLGTKTYKLSGIPPVDSNYSVNIIFTDTVLNCAKYYSNTDTSNFKSFQACTLSYKIATKTVTGVIQSQKIMVEDFIKVNNNQINYGLKTAGQISIVAFDLKGRQVTKIQRIMNAGVYNMKLNVSNLSLVYKISVGTKTLTKLVNVCK